MFVTESFWSLFCLSQGHPDPWPSIRYQGPLPCGIFWLVVQNVHRVSIKSVLFEEGVEGKLETFVVASSCRFLWELCWLWEERLLLLHRIL